MRVARLCAALAMCAPSCLPAQEPAAWFTVHFQADDAQSLRQGLVTLVQERLLPPGLAIDPQRASVTLSQAMQAWSAVEARPAWDLDADVLALPLMFDLRPLQSDRPAVRATLAVRLLQEVQVSARRLRKGSLVTCADLDTSFREVRSGEASSHSAVCAIEPGSVALRDIGVGEAVRAADIGRAPEVLAGEPVRVNVASGPIAVSTAAVALADAWLGDRIDVRLRYPTRTLKARVTGPGTVQLADEHSIENP